VKKAPFSDEKLSFERRLSLSQPKYLTPGYRSTIYRTPKQELYSFPSTLSEITGPIFSKDSIKKVDRDLTRNFSTGSKMPIGERTLVYGKVIDENGRGLPHTLLEIWQANASGRYRHIGDGYSAPLDPNFSGFGRCLTDIDGNYSFKTIKPGVYPWPNGGNNWRPAHIHFSISGQSFVQRLVTQMYFEGDPLIHICPIVNAIENKAAISSLIAKLDMSSTVHMDFIAYRFDIVLRGPKKTIFEEKHL
tara:strand:+ start:105 stop:845 length:741 start_codon:yes stop_codon:yes gene_type:complete